MKFRLEQSMEVLERTPHVMRALLGGLSLEWIRNNEGEGTWSPYDVLGHLIYGEKTDWMARVKIILSNSEDKLFEPFDRFAQMGEDQSVPIESLLEEFEVLREKSMKELSSLGILSEDLTREGIHPAFGLVSLEQLISTWAVHDLGHIAQISRVMAKQYREEVGPWIDYLRVLG